MNSAPSEGLDRGRFLLVVFLFTLSGVAGLIYQVLWVREFSQAFGNTIHSASLVLAVFMAGLGIGSYGGGAFGDRRYDKPGRLVFAYGICEISIGLWGLLLGQVLPRLGPLTASLSSYSRGEGGWYVLSSGSYLVRYALAIVLLSPATCLMGATLTLLIRYVLARDLKMPGSRIGALYGLNTAGAALGALLTDTVLVPHVGLQATGAVAVALNLVVGLAATWLARREADTPGGLPPAPAEVAAGGEGGLLAATALAVGLSGLAAMATEVVWFRVLSVGLGEFRSVFSSLLAVILVGLCLGSLLGGAIRTTRPLQLLMLAQGLFALSTLAFLVPPVHPTRPAFLLDRHPELARQLGFLGAAAWQVFVPSLFMGFSFPLANAGIQTVADRVGRRAGLLYFTNTLGAVVGSAAGGFVLLPVVGMQGGALFCSLCAAAAVGPLYVATRRLQGRLSGTLEALTAAACLVLALVLWNGLPPRYFVTRTLLPVLRPSERYLTSKEGLTEIVAVSEDANGDRVLYTNSHSMSATDDHAQRYMRAFSHVPLLLLEQPKDVLVICFGVGNTTHAASLHPSVSRLDVADLSPGILGHAAFFRRWNHDVLNDPRVQVFVDDGRNHLRMVPESSYDLVTLEPPPLAQAGVGSLYSKEFLALARSRLRPGGILTLWLPAYQVSGSMVLALVRAFVDAFPNAVLLSGDARELILAGRKGSPLSLDPGAWRARAAESRALLNDLRGVDLADPAAVAALFLADADALREATKESRALSDDRPELEYVTAWPFVDTELPASLVRLEGISSFCPGCLETLPDLRLRLQILKAYYASGAFRVFHIYSSRNEVFLLVDPQGALAEVASRSRYLDSIGGSPLTGSLRERGLGPPVDFGALALALKNEPSRIENRLRLCLAEISKGRLDDAVLVARRAVRQDPQSATAHFALGYAFSQKDLLPEAAAAYLQGLAITPGNLLARLTLASVYRRSGEGKKEHQELEEVLALDPENIVAHQNLGLLDLKRGDRKGAKTHADSLVRSGDPTGLLILRALELSGKAG